VNRTGNLEVEAEGKAVADKGPNVLHRKSRKPSARSRHKV